MCNTYSVSLQHTQDNELILSAFKCVQSTHCKNTEQVINIMHKAYIVLQYSNLYKYGHNSRTHTKNHITTNTAIANITNFNVAAIKQYQ